MSSCKLDPDEEDNWTSGVQTILIEQQHPRVTRGPDWRGVHLLSKLPVAVPAGFCSKNPHCIFCEEFVPKSAAPPPDHQSLNNT
jgi:hypothetical protein